ncbi:MAG: hypothetical protein LUG83_03790 [Lachnospiraceae bacterium]|nr:hypothetical protein [Lachnospiraceae bacterium]
MQKQECIDIIKKRIDESEHWKQNHGTSDGVFGSDYEDVKILTLEKIIQELSGCATLNEYLPIMEQRVSEAERDYEMQKDKPRSDVREGTYQVARCMSIFHTYRDLYALFTNSEE